MKNLVVGSASGFDWNALEPFVTSFARYVKTAELVLFVKDISDFTLDRIKRCGGERIKFEPFEHTNFIGIERFKNFKRYIDAHGDEYGQIFITDTRDVIFQDDIFEHFKNYSNFLGHSFEGGNFRVNSNYEWLVNCFGKDEADKLADKRIICAGSALIGTPREIKIFLEKLLDDSWEMNKFAFDQAAFNYLFYNNLIPVKNIIENDTYSGEIFTNGLVKDNKIRGDKILRGDGGVPSVVHQYDRHADLVALVDNIYRDKNFQVDERFMDSQSVLEQIFYLLYVNKTDDAAQFCMKNFSPELNRGENVDRLLKIWEFVAQRPLTPAIAFIELTIQAALKFAQGFSLNPLVKICSLLIYSAKNGRGVDFEFKIMLVNFLLNVIEQTINANNAEICFHFINVIKSFDLPPNKDFYLLEAKANRVFGRKEEALASYKKALDLS